jgi:hypothetical protein
MWGPHSHTQHPTRRKRKKKKGEEGAEGGEGTEGAEGVDGGGGRSEYTVGESVRAQWMSGEEFYDAEVVSCG